MQIKHTTLVATIGLCVFSCVSVVKAATDPLPSWNDGANKSAIINFVERVTKKGSEDFVPVAERIATFDNDGTLWAEQPLYFQAYFALDSVRAMAADHPDWSKQEPYKSAIAGDVQGLLATGKPGIVEVLAEQVYGIPPEQVVGSSLEAKFEMRDGIPVIIKEPELVLVDDKAGKPVGIYQHIGRRPIFAAGNSDGDLQMLQYTTIPRDKDDTTPRFGLIVHHTDAAREYAYDRESHMGMLDKGLDVAA